MRRFIVVWVLLCGPVFAGDLVPPAGPVTPTMKSLDEVEPRRAIASLPFVIDEPGSWYVTSGLTLAEPGDGITIDADGVVLDLSGFTIDGAGIGSEGIRVASEGPVTIRNGVVRGFLNGGIYNPMSNAALIEGIHALDNCAEGIATLGGIIRNCTVRDNGIGISWERGAVISDCVARHNGIGFQGGDGAAISDCTAVDSGMDEARAPLEGVAPRIGARGGGTAIGFRVGNSCTLTGCVAMDNGRYGIFGELGVMMQRCSVTGNGALSPGAGIFLGRSAVLTDVVASDNTGNGIETENSAVVTQCTVENNAGEGILTADASTIRGCTARDNTGTGIITGDIATVAQCTAFNNGDEGIAINASSRAVDCTVQESGRHGIFTSIYCEVTDCNVIRSGQHGIFTQSNCLAIGNNCQANGTSTVGHGLHVIGSNARIEQNHCVGNDIGIRVQFGDNYIFRNTCRGNGVFPANQYDIDTGNFVGPLVESPDDPAATAWANFTDLP